MKINLGKVIGRKYKKQVSFSKAVLWKDRQISINKKVVEEWIPKVDFIEFEDRGKQEIWIAEVEKVKKSWIFKKEGQEYQYYIPIEVFKKYIGTDYLSYKSGVKRSKFNKEEFENKEHIRSKEIAEAQSKLF